MQSKVSSSPVRTTLFDGENGGAEFWEEKKRLTVTVSSNRWKRGSKYNYDERSEGFWLRCCLVRAQHTISLLCKSA